MFTSKIGQLTKRLGGLWRRRFEFLTDDSGSGPLKKGLGLVVLVSIELLGCFYLTTQAAGLVRTIWQESQEIKSLESKAKRITESYQALEERSNLTEGLLESLSAGSANAKFLEKVNLLAGQDQLTLGGIRFESPIETGLPGLLGRRSELNLTGDYESLLTFVENLNRQSPSLVIEEIRLSLPENESAEKIKATLFALSYYSPEKN